ncbi:MAG: bifunctional phosphopantothenoylcysteine decarboxylase/phosphopantothenate--cysteine ligase CoaBC [Bdellovibrionales bacterium]
MSKSKLLLIMSGSIAAYKICHLISSLKKQDWEINVVASESALKFVGEATLEALSGNPVHTGLWQKGHAMDHIYLERWADIILAAPATAHLINRFASGIGDDLATNIFLAHQFNKPFLIAPAMNTSMYLNPVTQKSLTVLKELTVQILEAASGVLACGETGYGKLLEPELIQKEIFTALTNKTSKTNNAEAHKNKIENVPKILVTAGGTREAIDDVRFLTNASTGITGESLASGFSQLGFDVTLLLAESAQAMPKDLYQTKRFDSVASLSQLMESELKNNNYSAVVHCAAVGDYTIQKFEGKLSSEQSLSLQLVKTPKIINNLRSWSRNQNITLIGFKLTSGLTPDASDQEVKKLFNNAHLDYVIQNDTQSLSNRNSHRFVIHNKIKIKCESIGTTELLSQISPLIYKEPK